MRETGRQMLKNNFMSVLINIVVTIVLVTLNYIGPPEETSIAVAVFSTIALVLYVLLSYFLLNPLVQKSFLSVVVNCISQYVIAIFLLMISPYLLISITF